MLLSVDKNAFRATPSTSKQWKREIQVIWWTSVLASLYGQTKWDEIVIDVISRSLTFCKWSWNGAKESLGNTFHSVKSESNIKWRKFLPFTSCWIVVQLITILNKKLPNFDQLHLGKIEPIWYHRAKNRAWFNFGSAKNVACSCLWANTLLRRWRLTQLLRFSLFLLILLLLLVLRKAKPR